MYIFVSEAQSRLLDLTCFSVADEEVALTYEGGRWPDSKASHMTRKLEKDMTPEERRRTIREIVARRPLPP